MAAASQVITTTTLDILKINSFIRGYHAYMDVWEPTLGEILLAKPEPTNVKDKNAVAEEQLVGHVPFNIAPRLYQFLRRDVNEAFVAVTCEKVKRGGVYGLEIPCVYRLFVPPPYINRMKEISEPLIDCCRTFVARTLKILIMF